MPPCRSRPRLMRLALRSHQSGSRSGMIVGRSATMASTVVTMIRVRRTGMDRIASGASVRAGVLARGHDAGDEVPIDLHAHVVGDLEGDDLLGRPRDLAADA